MTRSRVLVIDASVTQSAGETDHPVSKACREFLNDVLTICHHAAVTPELHAEWKHHRSRFSLGWRSAMAARRKLDRIVPAPNAELRAYIDRRITNPDDRAAIEKDLHLVEAALIADKVIVSRDDKARGLFSLPMLQTLTWINPTRERLGG